MTCRSCNGSEQLEKVDFDPSQDDALGSVWDVLSGQTHVLTEMRDFVADLDEHADLRAAATLRSLTRFRDAMQSLPEDSDLGAPVEVMLQDLVLITRQMMSRLR